MAPCNPVTVVPGPHAPCFANAQSLFMTAVVGVYVLVYRPIIRKMDSTIKRSRSMLLLFPAEVVQNVGPIRETMLQYAKGVGRTD